MGHNPWDHHSAHGHSTYTRRHEVEVPSSDPIEEVEDVALFPRMTDWLRSLDDDPKRGVDGHNFSQFAPDFEREKYVRICDLDDLSPTALSAICQWQGMPNGTAKKLLQYTHTETARIRKTEKRRARDAAARRY